jgi:5-methylcytosine-specific restriction endonuclease McrA
MTVKNIMENANRVELDGVGESYTQPISDDQIIGEDGQCLYCSYVAVMVDGTRHEISRRAMQRYANQW